MGDTTPFIMEDNHPDSDYFDFDYGLLYGVHVLGILRWLIENP